MGKHSCSWFIGWGCTSMVMALVNVVEWIIKPQEDFLMIGIWNIVDATPILTIVILPVVSVQLLVRYADEYSVKLRMSIALVLMVLMVACLEGYHLAPDWFMLPDLASEHVYNHPYANYALAWGALCAVVTALCCFACAYAGARDNPGMTPSHQQMRVNRSVDRLWRSPR